MQTLVATPGVNWNTRTSLLPRHPWVWRQVCRYAYFMNGRKGRKERKGLATKAADDGTFTNGWMRAPGGGLVFPCRPLAR